ncbi:MAG: GNAT family N-acetyltransferase [Alphaproteobacteria bacterium]|nr:GNAT family N-acetyltransferase [Alphaproteobacteria bacterium]
MLKYMENLYEVRLQRKNICYIKNGVMYFKWAFPVARGGLNPTYTEKVNQTVLKDIIKETQDYKTVLATPLENLHKKYPDDLEFLEKNVVYGLEQKKPFDTTEKLKIKIVKSKEDLVLWGRTASKIYDKWDTDSIYESFKTDLRKKYATYFIFYKDAEVAGVSQIIRGGGCSAVYWIGVLPELRKQGYGTEVTKQTLNYEIAHKRCTFILTASDLGLIIYKKLGFQPIETFYEYNIKGL